LDADYKIAAAESLYLDNDYSFTFALLIFIAKVSTIAGMI
jgi:hypothetical protein